MTALSRSAGRSAPAAAAYRACESLTNTMTGKVHDFTAKQSAVASFIVGYSGTREQLWNAAEYAENRKDAVTAREITLNLPHESTPAQRQSALREFAELLHAQYGCAVDVSEHKPGKWDERNNHAHIQFTARAVDPKTGAFSKKKDRRFNVPHGSETVENIRAEWSRIVKTIAADPQKWDHRTYEKQGVDKVARPRYSIAEIAAVKIDELEEKRNVIRIRKTKVGIRVVRNRIARSEARQRGSSVANRHQSVDTAERLQADRGDVATHRETGVEAKRDDQRSRGVHYPGMPITRNRADERTTETGIRPEPVEPSKPEPERKAVETAPPKSEPVAAPPELKATPTPKADPTWREWMKKDVAAYIVQTDQMKQFIALDPAAQRKFGADVEAHLRGVKRDAEARSARERAHRASAQERARQASQGRRR